MHPLAMGLLSAATQGLAIMQLPLFVLAALPVRWFVGQNLDFGLCTLALL